MEHDDLKQRFSEMSDEYLENIISKNFSSYMPEALELVMQELSSRGIAVQQPEFDYLNDVPEIKEKNIMRSMVYWISSVLIGLWIFSTFLYIIPLSLLLLESPKWWVIIPILGTVGKLFAVLCIRYKNRFGYIVNITLSTVILGSWAYLIIAEEFFNVFIVVMAALEVALWVLLISGRKHLLKKH